MPNLRPGHWGRAQSEGSVKKGHNLYVPRTLIVFTAEPFASRTLV
jgi:hypothetical protein